MKIMNTSKKKKPITDKNVESVINKDKTSENVSQETGYSSATVKKEVKKGKLKLGFIQDSGDTSPPPVEQGQAQGTGISKPVLDFYATAYGFITFVDTMLWFVSKISKGAIEYERLDEKEKEICANALKAEERVLEILASQAWAVHVIVLMQLIGVFSQKIKLKKKPKKEEKKKPDEPTKEVLKKQSLKDVTHKSTVKKVQPMGTATKISPEVENKENDIEFLDTNEFGNIDNSDRNTQHETPKIHDENYGNPPKDGKGLKK